MGADLRRSSYRSLWTRAWSKFTGKSALNHMTRDKGYYGDQLINLKADPIDLKVESYVDKFFEDKKISFEMKEGGNEIIMKKVFDEA